MNKNLTNILSRLYVAEKKKKKLIVVYTSNGDYGLLSLLWKDGFIYGYSRIHEGKAIVFLKYFNSGSGFFLNLIFLKKRKVLLSELKNLSVLHKNYYYLVLTSKGILSGQRCVNTNTSGFLIARF